MRSLLLVLSFFIFYLFLLFSRSLKQATSQHSRPTLENRFPSSPSPPPLPTGSTSPVRVRVPVPVPSHLPLSPPIIPPHLRKPDTEPNHKDGSYRGREIPVDHEARAEETGFAPGEDWD